MPEPTPRRVPTEASSGRSASAASWLGTARAALLENRCELATSLPIGSSPHLELIMHESVTVRRKRLLHQSRYRGRLEGDLLLGGFADRHLASLSAAQLDRYEALMQESDLDLFAWITGLQPVPERHDHDVFRLLQDFGLVERRT
jgi:antitoxin CptB